MQSASNLTPTADWSPVTNTIVTTNSARTMSLTKSNDSDRFFRLRLP